MCGNIYFLKGADEAVVPGKLGMEHHAELLKLAE